MAKIYTLVPLQEAPGCTARGHVTNHYRGYLVKTDDIHKA